LPVHTVKEIEAPDFPYSSSGCLKPKGIFDAFAGGTFFTQK
jgi:hypothetical protein